MNKLSRNLDLIVKAINEENYRLARNYLNKIVGKRKVVSFGDEAFNSSDTMRFIIYEFRSYESNVGFKCEQVRGLNPDTDPNLFELSKA